MNCHKCNQDTEWICPDCERGFCRACTTFNAANNHSCDDCVTEAMEVVRQKVIENREEWEG